MRLKVKITVALLAVALATATRPARAENERPVQIAILQGFRLAVLSPFDHRYRDVLSAYGYATMPNFYEILSADGSYAVRRWLEFGGHFAYALGYGGATDTPR